MPAPETAQHLAQQRLPRGPLVISADAVAEDQRRRLLEALPRAIAEKGFDGTTVEQIVKLAQVRRNAFYDHFEDKRDCFTSAYEIAQERLLGALTYRCYTRVGLVDRIGSALQAGLDLLGSDPVLARFIVVEAPAAGAASAVRHHEWLDRYGRMLRLASIGSREVEMPRPAVEPAVVGGILSRVKQLVLAGETQELPALCPELLRFTLCFYGSPGGLSLPASASVKSDQGEPPQPQSPERSTVLEPA